MHDAAHFDLTPPSPAQLDRLAEGLNDEERRLLLGRGEEAPFCGVFLGEKRGGTYCCRLCGLPLFTAVAKFDSGTGWPSFTTPFAEAHLGTVVDTRHGMIRAEIVCARCGAHQGHVFPDGPPPTGRRYCINSGSLEFVAAAEALPDRLGRGAPEGRPWRDPAIRAFRIEISDTQLDEMRRRIAATLWPDKETVSDASQGVPLATMRKLAEHWATGYDWRRVEARLNALPQFVTAIDGLDVHFIHVRSRHAGAMPLLIAHGWPGSVIEQLRIVGPLTDPTAYGANASDAFDVVIPSMPGYGFSEKPAATGWDPARIARAWTALMERLGYSRWVAQGGDWGSFVVGEMALQAPPGLLGIHTNLPAAVPADVDKALLAGAPPAGLSDEELHAYRQLAHSFGRLDYARYMAARPQTLYGIADSPVGLAAWLLDYWLLDPHEGRTSAIAEALDRPASATGELTRDDVLDNVTLYWLTNTGVSAARLYWEYRGGFFNAKGVTIPVAVSAFPDDLYQAPRSWAERAYPGLIHYNQPARGGHFAAWEQPQLFSEELREGFRSLRQGATL